MTRVVRQEEGMPAEYPAVGTFDQTALGAAWQRIEYHIAHRFAPREVVWRIDGEAGEWHPPLAPVTAISAQQPGGDAFEPETGPMGGYLLPEGQVTVTATVGAGPVPAAVIEAVRRLATYLAQADAMPIGVTRFSSGAFNASIRRDDVAPAMALVKSGAADLLRAYRRN